MTATALAVSSALSALVAALLFAIRARDAERAHDAAVRSRDVALGEVECLRARLASDAKMHDALLHGMLEWANRAAAIERELAEADAELVRQYNAEHNTET